MKNPKAALLAPINAMIAVAMFAISVTMKKSTYRYILKSTYGYIFLILNIVTFWLTSYQDRGNNVNP